MLRKIVSMIEEQAGAVLGGSPCGIDNDWIVKEVEGFKNTGMVTERYKVNLWYEQSTKPDVKKEMNQEEMVNLIARALAERVLDQLLWEKLN
jgi:hypothetical protein